ncbi:MAG: hypothetical protein AB197_00980 [Parcubacteria bacterium C7867-002]|nr:MAG: hypothetical protein AB197_00980 [Parcubacteria bacterium C7867-002]
MKKYKNITLSVLCYVVLLVLIFVGVPNSAPVPPSVANSLNLVSIIISCLIAVGGIFFAFRSNKNKESAWAGNLLMVIGLVAILIFIWMYALSLSMTPQLSY